MFHLPAMALWILWTLWALMALWCCYNVNLFVRRLRKQGVRQRPRDEPQPPAAVIVPIKGTGADEGLADHVAGLLNQRYRQYRLIFVVESEDDPAYAALQPYVDQPVGGEGLTSVHRIVAGRAKRGGQKVHNQLAGLRQLADADRVVVFADADAVPDDRWLWRLATFLSRKQVGATTGYRWFIPGDRALPSKLLAVINSSVASLMGPDRRNFAWGGSMAFSRDRLPAERVADAFDGALSDDYQLTRVCRADNRRVYFVMRCLVASPVEATWGRLLEFGRRQYLITRLHAPAIWWVGLIATSVYLAGWLTAIGAAVMQASGWGWGLAAAAAVYLADVTRASRRRAAAAEVFDDATMQRLAPAFTLDRWATPLVMAVHWLIVVSSAFGRTITWAGVRYRIRGRQDVEIIDRDAR